NLSSRDTTCPRATPPVLARHHLSSRDTTCPRATPPVLARHHLSSRDTTCPRATPPLLARHHLSSRDTTQHRRSHRHDHTYLDYARWSPVRYIRAYQTAMDRRGCHRYHRQGGRPRYEYCRAGQFS